MTKDNEIATAANSKTMNAVEDTKLYAAADTASPNELSKTPGHPREPGQTLNKTSRNKSSKRKSK